MMPAEVLNIVLSHQPAGAVNRVLDWWRNSTACSAILLLHTGGAKEFEKIGHEPKRFVSDPRITTHDHQREMQSYTAVLAAAARFVRAHEFQYIYFSEYDHLPLVRNLNERQVEKCRSEEADVLGFRVLRVDDTSYPHFLYHASDPRFMAFWKSISVRLNTEVVLSMFGSGSFWTREAFLAVTELHEPFPMYLEIYLPSLAHHLGFRVRDFGEQNRFVHNLGDRHSAINAARSAGAWTLHPVKHLERVPRE
jgi:hypothetical protein